MTLEREGERGKERGREGEREREGGREREGERGKKREGEIAVGSEVNMCKLLQLLRITSGKVCS